MHIETCNTNNTQFLEFIVYKSIREGLFIVFRFCLNNYIVAMNQKVNLGFSIIILLALLFSPSTTRKLIDLVGPFNPTAYGCLVEQGYSWAIARIYSLDNGGSIDPNGLQTINNAFTGGFDYADGYMVICRNNDPTSQVQQVIDVLQPLYNQRGISFWIKVEPNKTPGCQWESYTQEDNCAFLTDALTYFSNLFSPPTYHGIFTTRNIWNLYFGNTCDLLAYLGQGGTWLWYADYDSTGHVNTNWDVNDFVPFGGWLQPVVKQVGGNVTVTLCNNPAWHAFIDLDYYPWWP